MLVIAVAAAGAGCGEDASLTADEAADQFEDGLAEDANLKGADVHCKDASEEDHWDCTARFPDGFHLSFQLKLEGNTLDIVKPADRVPPAK